MHTGGIQGGVHPQVQGIKGVVVPPLDALGNLFEADALHRADGVGKVGVDDLPADAHRLKNLGGLVGLQGGNAHFGGNFHDAGQDGFVVVGDGLVAVLVQHIALHQLLDAVLGQIGVDGPGAVAQKGGKVVHIPGLGAFQNDGNGGALLGAHQVLLDGGHRQQGGNGHMVFIHPPIGENHHIGPVPIGPVHLHKELVNGALQGGVGIVQQRYGGHPEARALHGPDLHQLHGGDDGVFDLQHPAVFRLFLQKIAVGADVNGGIGDDFLPQGINGRVGDLSKELLEVVKEGLVLFGQHRQGDVGTHGGDLLAAQLCHGHDGVHNVLIGVAEGLVELIPVGLAVEFHLLVGHRQLLQGYQVLIQPLAVGLPPGQLHLHLFVGDDLFAHRIHQQHLAGLEPGLAQNLFRGNIQHAHLTGQNQPSVRGDVIPGGPQAVPVQHRAHNVAVGEEDGCGAVPGLHHGGVVAVQVLLLPVHGGILLPGLGYGHHHRQGQGDAVHHQKFQGVVQHGGVGARGGNHRQNLAHVLFRQAGGLHGFLPGQHPVRVAPDGVDFAVVEDQPVGVGPFPAGGGIGGEPGVHHGNGAFRPLIPQIRVEGPQLVHQEHALVNHRPGGEGAHIGALAGLLKYPADHIEPPVKAQTRPDLLRPAHKAHIDAGHGVPGPLAQNLRVYRHLPPAQEGNPFLAADHLKQLLGLAALKAVLGKEKHTHAVVALLPDGQAEAAVEPVGDLQQNAHAVAHLAGSVLTGPVLQPLHNGQGIVHHAVAGLPVNIHNGTDAAGIVLESFLIQCLFHGFASLYMFPSGGRYLYFPLSP